MAKRELMILSGPPPSTPTGEWLAETGRGAAILLEHALPYGDDDETAACRLVIADLATLLEAAGAYIESLACDVPLDVGEEPVGFEVYRLEAMAALLGTTAEGEAASFDALLSDLSHRLVRELRAKGGPAPTEVV